LACLLTLATKLLPLQRSRRTLRLTPAALLLASCLNPIAARHRYIPQRRRLSGERNLTRRLRRSRQRAFA
jgi:hypothetical protein